MLPAASPRGRPLANADAENASYHACRSSPRPGGTGTASRGADGGQLELGHGQKPPFVWLLSRSVAAHAIVAQSDWLKADSVLVALFTSTLADAPLFRLTVDPSEANGL
jgi:hypothetical protein